MSPGTNELRETRCKVFSELRNSSSTLQTRKTRAQTFYKALSIGMEASRTLNKLKTSALPSVKNERDLIRLYVLMLKMI